MFPVYHQRTRRAANSVDSWAGVLQSAIWESDDTCVCASGGGSVGIAGMAGGDAVTCRCGHQMVSPDHSEVRNRSTLLKGTAAVWECAVCGWICR